MAYTQRKQIEEVATITKAVVEIKTLTVGGKQMTKAVFNQIPEEPILELEGDYAESKGVPLGTVNYQTEENSYHLLWTDEKKLYRCMLGLSNS
jgi:hypothetical protein